MWDQPLALPLGRLSMRKFFISMLAILMAVFACLGPISDSANAQAPTAKWEGAAIVYEGHQYHDMGPAKDGASHKIPTGSKLYAYAEIITSSPSHPTSKAHIIYFAPGADPATTTSAKHVVYDYEAPDKYSNPSATTDIAITLAAMSSTGTTSCSDKDTAGIGWIVCPVTRFLARAMDWMFGIISGFLTVRPIQSTQETALYRAWSFARNFANIAFVIGFLVLIYSQLTSIGISNYNIKKMLPRLVVAAVLVNISYWICAIAIDVSNILGYSIQDIFVAMRNSLVGTEGSTWNVTSFESVSSFVLSGGTVALAAGFGAHALLAGTVTGTLYLLLPILVGVLVSAVVALLVMAGRQALITILVILSPLAFVAYLLPNTEKYFEKWRSIMTTMLIMFPLFSVIFGGSQLAGSVIIQNADSINMIILGMAVQVAPIVITPMLIKFSGSLLGRIAGIVNNPSKGLVDRTRNWSKERSEQRKAKVLGNLAERDENGLPRRRRDSFARASRGIEMSKRRREDRLKTNQSWMDADAAKQSWAHDNHDRAETANLVKTRGEAAGQAHHEAKKATDARLQQLDISARRAKQDVDTFKSRVDANWDEMRAGDFRSVVTPDNLSTSALANFLHDRRQQAKAIHAQAIEANVESDRQRSAKDAYTQRYAKGMEASPVLQRRAGGIAENGALKAQAQATSAMYAEQAKMVEAIKQASPITSNDIPGMADQFAEAIRTHNAEAARAYTDRLAGAGNPGVAKLREMLVANESLMDPGLMISLKEHINDSGAINAGAEDIAQWSRDEANRTISEISQDAKTWNNIAPATFAKMKASSQLIALGIPGAVSPKTARTIKSTPAYGDLKPKVVESIDALAAMSDDED